MTSERAAPERKNGGPTLVDPPLAVGFVQISSESLTRYATSIGIVRTSGSGGTSLGTTTSSRPSA